MRKLLQRFFIEKLRITQCLFFILNISLKKFKELNGKNVYFYTCYKLKYVLYNQIDHLFKKKILMTQNPMIAAFFFQKSHNLLISMNTHQIEDEINYLILFMYKHFKI